ncbi:MAG: VWA domain-containing protein [Candidatus Solibacter sp.]
MTRILFILGLAVAVQTIGGQDSAVPSQPYTLRTTAELVLLDVSVKSAAGEPVSGLDKSNFTVYEDGKPQTISHFASEDVPVTAGLVIDTSGSMRPKYPEVVTSAMAMIGASNRNDEIFIVYFSDRVRLGLPDGIPFTGDLNILRSALWRGIPEGRTALNDAIVFALKHLELGKRDRRTLVLVSDGGDNGSVHVADDVMRKVLESRATIYTIGIIDADNPDRNPALLRRIALVSGGEAYFPKLLSEVAGISVQIANDIRARYTIGYVPVHSSERGSLRKITVTAAASGGHKLTVHTRTSYMLPPKPQAGL